MFVGVVNDGQFRRFCAAIGRESLVADVRFSNNEKRVTHRTALKSEIESVTGTWPAEGLAQTLMKAGVPAACVNNVAAALNHPHTAHRELLVHGEGGYTGLRSPMKLMGTPAVPGHAPPAFDQDRQAILARIGASERDFRVDVAAASRESASTREVQEVHMK